MLRIAVNSTLKRKSAIVSKLSRLSSLSNFNVGRTTGSPPWLRAASMEKQETGDGQNGGWLRSHVEATTCEIFTRLAGDHFCTCRMSACPSTRAKPKLLPTLTTGRTSVYFADTGISATGVCKIKARSKTERHESQPPFPQSSMLTK